jgi:hypothetical protein
VTSCNTSLSKDRKVSHEAMVMVMSIKEALHCRELCISRVETAG